MLDYSPVALPPIPRPLKRSASTASLPTPPRSHHKHAKGKSRGFCDSDSNEDSDVVLTSDDEMLGERYKKRRIGETKRVDEDGFWLGDIAVNAKAEAKNEHFGSKSGTTAIVGPSQAAPLLYRRRQAQVDVALVSPPLSYRRPAIATPKALVTRKPDPHTATDSPPVTPKTRSSTRRALRDSPDNPFLVTPEKHVDDTPSPSDSSANPSPHDPLKERPTIAYVFRGVRRECKNPLYNYAQHRPFSPPPESQLPIDHPDYSPAIHCTPKRLFANALPKKKKRVTSKQDTPSRKWARQRSPSLSADEGNVGEIRPLKLDFGPRKRAGAQTLDQEL
ncbi:hypothetical protein BYT27DRAFT_7229831 [Phlegmacium glaucopus]|nr:hypothetical protein BYT27DRAFT_7229831 [Phlegmacium glaucopus]